MTILIYTNFQGHYVTLRNPSQITIDAVLAMYPDAIMKVYDFKACEIVTFINEEFSWSELCSKINGNLANFQENSKKSA